MPSTSSTLLPQDLTTNLHYPRRLLLQTPVNHLTPAASPSYQLDSASSSSHDGFNANLVMILTVLLCALICSLCVNTLIRCMIKCTRLIAREGNYNINMISHEVPKQKSGLDKRALKTFPIVKYSKEVKIQGLDTECVICLSEFVGGEKVRILPKCNHGFHVKCIDKWLKSHSSCPTCRQSLVETCQKIIGCDDQQTSSPSVEVTRDIVAINIVPLQREDLVRNYRAQAPQ